MVSEVVLGLIGERKMDQMGLMDQKVLMLVDLVVRKALASSCDPGLGIAGVEDRRLVWLPCARLQIEIIVYAARGIQDGAIYVRTMHNRTWGSRHTFPPKWSASRLSESNTLSMAP